MKFDKKYVIPEVLLVIVLVIALGVAVWGIGGNELLKGFRLKGTENKNEKNPPVNYLPRVVNNGLPDTRQGGITATGKLMYVSETKFYVILDDPNFPQSLTVRNSSDLKIKAALQPLEGKTVTVMGTLIQGGLGKSINVTVVNGVGI